MLYNFLYPGGIKMVWVSGFCCISFYPWGSCGRGVLVVRSNGYLERPQELSKISTESSIRVHFGCAPRSYRKEGQFIRQRK